ncbi:hypothetical protein PSTG_15379 [Puccinia striiformis f. sp. tritici PST-78]|uniref:RxLR effector protein n=1 Tax=Puccinia striiformis f. sp. tritici PST-78 TaxID=1165861 RepID=A0A0L0UW17_9BASI|nr:hypothetical protein PSTG_15379 [Puccinia striiformis f. sp. tritici PST-78]
MRVTQSLILAIFAAISSLAVAMPADEPAAKVGQPISRDSTSKVLAGGATREPDTKVDQPISRDSSPKAAKLKTRSDKERHSLLTKIFTHIGAGVNTDLNRDPEDSA